MGLFVWTIIGAVLGFAASALAARKFHHRLAPAVLLGACMIAFAITRWAVGRPDVAELQVGAFYIGCALLGAASGGVGWLIFARQRWAMISSVLAALALIAAAPLIVPILARTFVGIS